MSLSPLKKLILSALLLLASLKAFCGVIDHEVMFQAYLDNDMTRWGTEIEKYIAQPDLTIDDKIDLSNYLYGYVAAILETKKKSEIESLIKVWNGYLNEIEAEKGNRADVHVYRSAIAAYKFKLNPILLAQATRSLNELDRALDTDPNNFLALQLKGNVKFYMPGNKKEAIAWFERALQQLDTSALYRWNQCAITLCLAQAYEKTGNPQKAIEVRNTILNQYPNFIYMRDDYYPSFE
jgi:tetratricopeptide (TPR) repeat protein